MICNVTFGTVRMISVQIMFSTLHSQMDTMSCLVHKVHISSVCEKLYKMCLYMATGKLFVRLLVLFLFHPLHYCILLGLLFATQWAHTLRYRHLAATWHDVAMRRTHHLIVLLNCLNCIYWFGWSITANSTRCVPQTYCHHAHAQHSTTSLPSADRR